MSQYSGSMNSSTVIGSGTWDYRGSALHCGSVLMLWPLPYKGNPALYWVNDRCESFSEGFKQVQPTQWAKLVDMMSFLTRFVLCLGFHLIQRIRVKSWALKCLSYQYPCLLDNTCKSNPLALAWQHLSYCVVEGVGWFLRGVFIAQKNPSSLLVTSDKRLSVRAYDKSHPGRQTTGSAV